MCLFFSAALISCNSGQGSFTFINKASEKISSAQISVSGQEIDFDLIDVDAQASGSYKISRDSHYVITIQFESGKEMVSEIGYVTPGVNFYHEIIVDDSHIWISKSDIRH